MPYRIAVFSTHVVVCLACSDDTDSSRDDFMARRMMDLDEVAARVEVYFIPDSPNVEYRVSYVSGRGETILFVKDWFDDAD